MMRRTLVFLLCGLLGLALLPTTPAAAAPPTISTVSAGAYHNCGLTSGGGVLCWGYNTWGTLGNGTHIDSPTPAWVSGLGTGVVAVSGGLEHTCALTSSGGVKCWGGNGHGQVGPNQGSNSTTPVDVSGLGGGVVAIGAGRDHTCAVTSSGGVKCWGRNDTGQLGDGTTALRYTPVAVSGLDAGVVSVSGGGAHSCALTSSGAVLCWGWNAYGQLGDGTTTNSLTPVPVSGLDSGVVAISAGSAQTCALTSGGAVLCWGYNGSGQLGDGTTTNSSTPVAVSGLGSGVGAISAGDHHTCALTNGGGAQCWGYNGYGQLGDGTTTGSLTPVGVSGLGTGVVAIGAGYAHTCAAFSGGGVRCWGYNISGQLGNGTTTDSSTPVEVRFGQTATTLESTQNPSTFTQPVTFIATVNPTDGGGTVAFSADGTAISGCESQPVTLGSQSYQATCTTSSLSLGDHSITAAYTGDALYDSSTSPALHQDVSVCSAPPGCVIPVPWQVTAIVQLVLDTVGRLLP